MTDGLPVRITVKGRVGPSLQAALPVLYAEVVPRHNVIVVDSVDLSDLVAVLEALEQRCIEVERITRRLYR